jgi:hypothetical protein
MQSTKTYHKIWISSDKYKNLSKYMKNTQFDFASTATYNYVYW